jgi:hypothetical protein
MTDGYVARSLERPGRALTVDDAYSTLRTRDLSRARQKRR